MTFPPGYAWSHLSMQQLLQHVTIFLEKPFWGEESGSPVLATPFTASGMTRRGPRGGAYTLPQTRRHQTPNGTDFQGW